MTPVYPALEITTSVLFAVAAWAAWRRGRLAVLTLVSAAIFGIVLEDGSQVIFETYEYSPHWSLVIGRAPVVIALAWALIITGAMRITDALGVRRRYAPFLDAVLAITLDLAFDAVAIRMGFWTWRGIGASDGWFGVPAGNLYTWLFITFSFSLLSRTVRAAAADRPRLEWLQLLTPIPAFWIVLAAITALAVFEARFEPPPGGWLEIFALVLAVFVAVALIGISRAVAPRDRESPDLELRLAFVTRLAIHAFFLAAMFAIGLATRLPALLLVALLMLALEAPLGWLATRRPTAGTAPQVASAARANPQRSADAP